MRETEEGAYGAPVELLSTEPDQSPSRLTIALAWAAAQRAREEHLPAALTGNAAWDVLLALYISFAEGRSECVKNICIASSEPATTVIRWTIVLESLGLITRTPDFRDRRKVQLRLTQAGVDRMDKALDACARSDARHGVGRLRVVRT